MSDEARQLRVKAEYMIREARFRLYLGMFLIWIANREKERETK